MADEKLGFYNILVKGRREGGRDGDLTWREQSAVPR